jgi:hypothetical protein
VTVSDTGYLDLQVLANSIWGVLANRFLGFD